MWVFGGFYRCFLGGFTKKKPPVFFGMYPGVWTLATTHQNKEPQPHEKFPAPHIYFIHIDIEKFAEFNSVIFKIPTKVAETSPENCNNMAIWNWQSFCCFCYRTSCLKQACYHLSDNLTLVAASSWNVHCPLISTVLRFYVPYYYFMF